MRTVHKFPMEHPTLTVRLPRSAKVVTVATQHGHPTLWIETESEAPSSGMVERTFVAHGTGHLIPDGETYVGTAHEVEGAGLVFHVYEASR